MLGKIIVNSSVTGGEIDLYDDSSLPCDLNPVGALYTDSKTIFDVKHTFSNGLSVKTSGSANLNISILYRVSP